MGVTSTCRRPSSSCCGCREAIQRLCALKGVGPKIADALHGIKVTGDVGKEPAVKWNGKLDVKKTTTQVVSAGDGDKVAEGDQVIANIWVGNGYTQKKAYSTYDDGARQAVTRTNDVCGRARSSAATHVFLFSNVRKDSCRPRCTLESNVVGNRARAIRLRRST